MLLVLAEVSSAQNVNDHLPPTQQGVEGWTKQTIAAVGNSGRIFFINRDTGWVTFADGLFFTTNAGNQWNLIAPPPINTIYFSDVKNGWAVNDTSLIRTSDGGKTWKLIKSPVVGQVKTFGMDTIYTYEDGRWRFARSTDGGKTWVENGVEVNNGQFPITFADSKYGFIGGENVPWRGNTPPAKNTPGAAFQKTTDGGITWKQKYCPLQENIGTLYALDQNTLLASASGAHSNMVRTTDGGNTWDTIFTGQWSEYYFFLNKMNGYALSGNLIQYTNDGGKTWIMQPNSDPNYLNNIFFVDSLNGWIAGEHGVVLHTDNGGKSFVTQHPVYDSIEIRTFPDPVVTNAPINFQYTLPIPQHVNLVLYDQLGHAVQVILQNEMQSQGSHTFPVNLMQNPNGTYYYQFVSEQYRSSGKITIIK